MTAGDADLIAALLRGHRFVVLSGAGMSTDSGIPDYRGPNSARANPMQYGEFVRSEESRRRYWARSYLGWRRMGGARPNPGHAGLVTLERHGLRGVITQNVDGLHAAAGSGTVIDLHGEIAKVVCLDCGERTPRRTLQDRLAALNPGVVGDVPAGTAELRPDGDAVVQDWHDFRVAACVSCGGRLKPDVVFFGETVPKPRVEQAYALLEDADLLLVLGSSLTVMSGLRFVRHQARRGRPVLIVNRGATRGDDLATVKLDAGCSETVAAVVARLAASTTGATV